MKYAPLKNYLQAISPSKQLVTLTFEQIEKIIKAKLPRSAFTYREWWANQQRGARATYWLAAGFVVDEIVLGKRLVYFRRDSAVSQKRSRQRSAVKQSATKKPIAEKQLQDAGFRKFGSWELKNGHLHLTGNIPSEPGVYAHVVDGEICYIGSATSGLKKRLYFYGRPGKSQLTSIRINGLIIEALNAGKTVELIAAFPSGSSWNGLPVDLVTGLESGLIKKFGPPWNKRGVLKRASSV